MARADTQTRAAATAGFLNWSMPSPAGLMKVRRTRREGGRWSPHDPDGALTVSRVVTDQALSDAILRNAEDSITGSQTTGGKKAKRSG